MFEPKPPSPPAWSARDLPRDAGLVADLLHDGQVARRISATAAGAAFVWMASGQAAERDDEQQHRREQHQRQQPRRPSWRRGPRSPKMSGASMSSGSNMFVSPPQAVRDELCGEESKENPDMTVV